MFPFLDNKELYAIVLLEKNDGKNRIGIVPCTNTVFKRLIGVPSHPGSFMLCEELILHFVSKLFDRYNIIQKSVMRVTRNADIDAGDVYDEDLDYRDVMEHLIRQRKRLSPVRLELSRDINENTLEKIALYLGIEKNHIIRVNTPLDFSFTRLLQNYLSDKTELFYKQYSPRLPAGINVKESLIKQIEQKDILLSYPFESMKPFMRLLNDAAEDESVVAIMITLYRVADRSKVIELLSEAAENGKRVIVLVELRARFDEENNIEWSKQLQEAGVNVIYGPKEYKAHSKLLLITRKAQGGNFDYVTQIGTGNYNEKTAALYTDLMLLTADRDIAADAEAVFAGLINGTFVENTKKLLVSPLALRPQIIEMIDEQIAVAKSGGNGYIAAKVNSLNDFVIINKLVEASQAGVKIELVIRGLCCLIAGVQGYTENITVRSIVGRFLEHSRIFIFGTDSPQQKIYIGSADYMSRNTVRRVEVAAPVEDERLRKRIREMFRIFMNDNVKARIMLSDGTYIHERRNPDTPFNSQEYLYEEAYKRLEDKSARQEQMKVNRENGAKKKATAQKTASKKPTQKKTEKKTPAKRGRKKNTP
jgi:polyphosphate kinase